MNQIRAFFWFFFLSYLWLFSIGIIENGVQINRDPNTENFASLTSPNSHQTKRTRKTRNRNRNRNRNKQKEEEEEEEEKRGFSGDKGQERERENEGKLTRRKWGCRRQRGASRPGRVGTGWSEFGVKKRKWEFRGRWDSESGFWWERNPKEEVCEWSVCEREREREKREKVLLWF